MATGRRLMTDLLSGISVRDIERTYRDTDKLRNAQAKLQSIADETENPKRIDKKTGKPTRASKNIKFLSSSIKFDKAGTSSDPMVRKTSQKGMYVMPAGLYGTADCCGHKTGPCSAACLHDTGFQDLANQIARTNALEQMGPDALAILAAETDDHVRASENFSRLKGGPYLPAIRYDATSELKIDNMEAGDFIMGRHATLHTEGPFKGLPRLLVPEYAKEHAKDVLSGPEPVSRQPNVTRVPSWSEKTTLARGQQLRSRGIDIAVPATNYGSSTNPKPVPSHVSVQFKGGSLVLPAVDYDEHDNIALRPFTGSAGILRAKNPTFGQKRSTPRQRMAEKFLTGDHTPYEPGVNFEGPSPVTDPQTSELHNNVRRRINTRSDFGSREQSRKQLGND